MSVPRRNDLNSNRHVRCSCRYVAIPYITARLCIASGGDPESTGDARRCSKPWTWFPCFRVIQILNERRQEAITPQLGLRREGSISSLPEKEPTGYIESLKHKEPEIIFDPAQLRTEQDWTRAGAIVFRAPREFRPLGPRLNVNAEVIRAFRIPTAREGIVPYFQYVVRKKGVVELGIVACADCHTRVLPDGTTAYGAQGNFPWSGRDALAEGRSQAPDRDQRALNVELKMYAKGLMSCMPRRRSKEYAACKPCNLAS
jgi:hypothetical protein